MKINVKINVKIKSVLAFFVLASFTLTTLGSPFTLAAAAELIKVNPQTLRSKLLESDIHVLMGFNKVKQAKDQVNISRTSLLPSLNLNFATAPNFLLSSVSFLLPFLMPSNWLALKENKLLLKSEKISHYILQLNEYASAYSIYQTMVSDVAIREVQQKQYDNLMRIYEVLEQGSSTNGNVSQKDLAQALGQAQMAKVQLDNLDRLLAQEKAALRHFMSLELDQELLLEITHVPSSNAESLPVPQVAQKATLVAPEGSQLDYMISAAKVARWVKLFGFFSSSTLSSAANSSGSASFSLDRMAQSNSATNIGFAMIPNLQLGNHQIESLQLQKVSTFEQVENIIETTLTGIEKVQSQIYYATLAESNFTKVYEMELLKYRYGLTDLLHVLSAENQLTIASMSRVQGQNQLDQLRINLHRALITDEFSKVANCGEKEETLENMTRKQRRRMENSATLDEVCALVAPALL